MRYIAAIFLLLTLSFPGSVFAAGTETASVTFEKDTLVIKTRSTEVPIIVELAKTPAQQMQGLKGRKSLDRNHGMLFLNPEDKRMIMWMKDTPISLDLLFIDKRGQIVYIASRTTPFSTEPISARFPIRAVLEVAGGTARSLRLRTGDKIIYSAFEPSAPRQR